ncbi:esterase [Caballeronia arationis]|jgi:enterochelin esterase-like enzyme|uniref:Esterase n=1 Tax=Caballeronia arationis TaxID=1777142 RepID=A0A7Z7I3Q6_9BURK|nr:alpha/beta hydrolase-fold protein [Caballeronia arationis]SAK79152.1 esterase [Caballeronia arationis]SOE59724.1 Putative esterase [Caballeronia arationis]
MLLANRRAMRLKTRLTVSLAAAGAIVAAYAAPQAASAAASESVHGAKAVRQATASTKPIPGVLTSAAGSKVVARTMHSEALDRDWPYVLYLPPGYAPRDGRYPVLYLLHGNNGDAYDWITQGRLQTIVDRLIAQHEIPPLLIVMPQGGTDWYVDRKEPIETAFFEELLPEIETKYAAQTGREG